MEQIKQLIWSFIGGMTDQDKINNLAAVTNNCGLQPFVINGRPLKSMNQYYNKEKAKMQSDLKTRHDKNWSHKLMILTSKRNRKISKTKKLDIKRVFLIK